jgi:GNAT superfamily N-acetyltransferase
MSADAAAAVAAVRRTQQAWYEYATSQFNLGCGIVFTSEEWPASPELNQFREVQLIDTSIEAAWSEAEAAFAERGCACGRWVPAGDQDAERFVAFLDARGFERVDQTAMLLTHWPAKSPRDGVRLVPARSVQAKCRALIAAAMAEGGDASEEAVDVALVHLDDPQLEWWVAVIGGEAVGIGGIYQVGDLATVRDLFVAPDRRRAGIGTAIIAHLLAIARRLTPRVIVASAPSSSSDLTTFLTASGYEPAGAITEFHRRTAGP